MSDKKEIRISAAKGRPMLSWVGKRPLRHVTPFPAQHIESFSVSDEGQLDESAWGGWPEAYPKGGLLFHGDNKEVLAHLLANGFRGLVKLIYIDPPFDSGADYVRKVQLRGGKATTKIEGESYNLGEQIQYTDIWANDNYLQFMYERLMLLKELLATEGVIALHCDDNKVHLLRCLLDEVFGADRFVNEVVWHFPGRAMHLESKFNRKHNNILIYAKSNKFLLDEASEEWDREEFIKTKKQAVFKDEDGREYIWQDRSGGESQAYKRYLDDVIDAGKAFDDVWKFSIETSSDKRRTSYPTQKPEALLERIIKALSKPDELILDCFIGSGTTAAVAQKLGRRWIGCDINKGAIQTTSKRLQYIIEEQYEAIKNAPTDMYAPEKHEGHKGAKEFDPECPLCLSEVANSFTLWRVNDYDLKIQRNEAIKLACEHIGIERIPSDSYFEGKLGKKLVKIIAFEHPLSPLDLEEFKRELDARPELASTIVFVCLGIELAARTWIDDWNRLLKGEHAVNKIEVIELRTDAKYGNFIKHEPATGKVSITRESNKIKVNIEDFISPTILKRLDMDMPVFKAKITDWRSQVDCVMIDTEYEGKVFNVVLSDVPEKKNDLIEGSYIMPAPVGSANVAVKIIDMLGEEVLILAKV